MDRRKFIKNIATIAAAMPLVSFKNIAMGNKRQIKILVTSDVHGAIFPYNFIQNREESQRTLLQFLHPAFHNHCKHTRLEAPQQQRGCEEVGGEEAEEARFIQRERSEQGGIGARPRDTGTDREWYAKCRVMDCKYIYITRL